MFAVHPCGNCSEPSSGRCGRCRSVYYCSETCQQHAWSQHKLECKKHKLQAYPASLSGTKGTSSDIPIKERVNDEEDENATLRAIANLTSVMVDGMEFHYHTKDELAVIDNTTRDLILWARKLDMSEDLNQDQFQTLMEDTILLGRHDLTKLDPKTSERLHYERVILKRVLQDMNWKDEKKKKEKKNEEKDGEIHSWTFRATPEKVAATIKTLILTPVEVLRAVKSVFREYEELRRLFPSIHHQKIVERMEDHAKFNLQLQSFSPRTEEWHAVRFKACHFL